MAVSNTPIITPVDNGARRTLKKSTVMWLLGVCSLAVLAIYYVPRVFKAKPTIEDSAASKTSRPAGTEKTIEQEFADAKAEAERVEREKKAAEQRARDAELAKAPPAPLPTPGGRGVEPAGNRPFDTRSANVPEIDEIEVQARLSKSIVSDGNGLALPGSEVNDAVSAVDQRIRSLSTPASQAGSADDARARQIETMAQIAKAQAGSPKPSDASWLKEYAEMGSAKANRPTQVRNPFTLLQGKVIPAVLGKRLVSDLPGEITAFTTIDVYDSLTGTNMLIPKGSQLVGSYSNQVRDGQDRLFFAFRRIILPNGISFDLPAANGQDGMGMAGVGGEVNNHYFKRIASGLFAALLADRLERHNTAPVTNIGATGTSSAAGQVLVDMAKAETSRNMGIPPTITVPEGTRINVQVVGDMEFPGIYKRL